MGRGKKDMVLSLKDIQRRRFEEKLWRLRNGLPLKPKRTKPRDPEKSEAYIDFLVRTTPPAKDILSGKAFSELLRKAIKGKPLSSSVR